MGAESESQERFSRDVDLILDRAGIAERDALPADYGAMLRLARRLASMELATDRGARAILRRRLIALGETPRSPKLAALRDMRLLPRRLPRFALPALVLLCILATSLILPGTLTAAAQSFETMVQQVVLRRSQSIRFVAMPSDRSGSGFLSRGDQSRSLVTFVTETRSVWEVRTPIGRFGGSVPPGQSPAVGHFATLDETEDATQYSLLVPGYLPQGYTFSEGLVAPADAAYFVYDGPDSQIVLAQVRVAERHQEAALRALTGARESIAAARMLATVTDKPVRMVPLDDDLARWIEGHGLIWESDNMSLLVGGTHLDLDEATRIAISLSYLDRHR